MVTIFKMNEFLENEGYVVIKNAISDKNISFAIASFKDISHLLASVPLTPSNPPPSLRSVCESPLMSDPALPHEPAATDGVVPTDDPEHAGSLRELLRIAVPLMISSGSVSVMHLANRMFLTW